MLVLTRKIDTRVDFLDSSGDPLSQLHLREVRRGEVTIAVNNQEVILKEGDMFFEEASEVEITLIATVSRFSARIGFQADPEVSIVRSELLQNGNVWKRRQ